MASFARSFLENIFPRQSVVQDLATLGLYSVRPRANIFPDRSRTRFVYALPPIFPPNFPALKRDVRQQCLLAGQKFPG